MDIQKQDDIAIDDIVVLLKDGKTLVYPTETCYGLGCDATQANAVDRVFAIKQRQKDKPVLVLFSDVEMAMQYVSWNQQLETIAERYWPGPLTVVSDVLDTTVLPEGIVGPDGTLAFRITNHPLVRDICVALGAPLVSTSANIAALESPYDIESVLAMFSDTAIQPDTIIDAGPLPHHSPSTIVRVLGDRLEVLRQGEIILQ